MGADQTHENKELALAPVPVLGREADLEAIATSDASVLLLTGDSGIGKSALLRLAQDSTHTAAAPPPITLAAAPGSLHRALLQGLGDATAAVMHKQGEARAIGDRLTNAATRLAEEKGIELAKVLGRAVLLKAKEKLGAEAVDLIIEYTQELGKAGDEALLARISASADPSITDVLVGFADELARIAGDEKPIVLALDAGELMHDDDRRLLSDLANRLPKGFQVRVAFSTWSEQHLTHAEEIVVSSAAIAGHQLGGLPMPAIVEWLRLKGLPPEGADEVSRKTHGYPLFIEDSVADLSGSGATGDVSALVSFTQRTYLTWRSLDQQAQAAARQLVVFESPLPENVLMGVCNLTPAEWGSVLERLQRAGILSGTVNGIPWFHPQRQEVIRGYLRDNERAELEDAAAAAIAAYLGYAETGRAPEVTANVAQLAAASTRLLEQQPGVRVATELHRDQLAVLAALIELSERNAPLVNAVQVLLHARDFFAAAGDLVEALESLGSTGLVQSISARTGTLIQPAFPDATTRAVVQGRALLELGRLPLPGLVSSVFAGLIRPRVEPFAAAGYGVSSESLRHSIRETRKLSTVAGGPLLGRGGGHYLIIRAQFHGRPITATVSFANADDRDAAQARLIGLSLEFLGGQFAVTDTLIHPEPAIPATRFLNAVERLLGRRLNRTTLKLPAVDVYDLDDYMRIRVRTLEFVHRLATNPEREVYDLREPPSIHWHASSSAIGQDLVYAEVNGGSPLSVRHDEIPVISWTDRLAFFRYAKAFGLGQGERIRTLSGHVGQPSNADPVVDALADLYKKAAEVTQQQTVVKILVSPKELEHLLVTARSTELDDARELSVSVPLVGEDRPEPPALATYICIYPATRPLISRLQLASLETVSTSGQEEVHVLLDPPPVLASGADPRQEFGALFDTQIQGDLVGLDVVATATEGLARFLGYQASDIMLMYPSGRPADLI